MDWREALTEAEDEPELWRGGPTDRTELIAARHRSVVELEQSLSVARAVRDKLMHQATGTSSYRIHQATGMSKPAVTDIRGRDNGNRT